MLNRRSICLAALATIYQLMQAGASADDYLLGVPEARDPEHPGSVVLHGGGGIDPDTIERFVDLAGGDKARIVIVPTAGYSPADYADENSFLDELRTKYESWLNAFAARSVAKWQFVYTDQREDADDPEFVQPLETATGVWFSGGKQSRLKERFVGSQSGETRFQAALKSVVERGGVVGGTSAGMAALPEIMTVYEQRSTLTGPTRAVADRGFGLLKQAIVEQHFDGRLGRMERFTQLLRDSELLDGIAGRAGAGKQMAGLAVEERTALIVQGNQLQVMGEGLVHVFLKSQLGRAISWHELGHGETALLKRDDEGQEILQRDDALLAR